MALGLFAIPACFLSGFEKVEGTGAAGGASGGAPPVCETVTFVATTDGETSTSDPRDFFNALRVVDFGEVSLATRPGFDLDGVCTCCIDCEQTPTCNPPPGAQGEECDSVEGVPNSGRDNNVARFLAGPDSAPLGLSSTALRSAIDAGTWSLLLRVSDWNGLPDDGQVTLAVHTTGGVVGTPKWDGSDLFQVRADSVSAATPEIDEPIVVNEDAYVANGMLVAVFGTQRQLVLHLARDFTVELSYAVLQAELREEGTGYVLTDGVIGGIWDMRAVFKALAGARVNEMPLICTDSPSYDSVKQALCVMRDSLDDPEPITCGGISFGMGFTGARIVKPSIVEPLTTSTPCPSGTDPTNDICE